MPLTIYHVAGTRSMRVIWLCLELDIPLEVEVIDFSPAYRNTASWRALSPTGKVPVLRDGEFTMFESGAMVQYLLDAYGDGRLQPRPGTKAAALFQQWSWFAEATLARPLGDIAQHSVIRPEAERIPGVVEDAKVRALTALGAVEKGLENCTYLMGEAFSAADINMGYSLMLAERFGLLHEDLMQTRAYFSRLKDRPFYQEAIC
ncbi:MAG: glutathione S-transferase family protein [Candidatus Azotimanducaceae bacterium]